MTTPRPIATPATEVTTSPCGPTSPPRDTSTRVGGFSAFPEIGDTVQFRRSPTHAPETGFVKGRLFGSRDIEIVDANAKPLRLTPSQYEVITP